MTVVGDKKKKKSQEFCLHAILDRYLSHLKCVSETFKRTITIASLVFFLEDYIWEWPYNAHLNAGHRVEAQDAVPIIISNSFCS